MRPKKRTERRKILLREEGGGQKAHTPIHAVRRKKERETKEREERESSLVFISSITFVLLHTHTYVQLVVVRESGSLTPFIVS